MVCKVRMKDNKLVEWGEGTYTLNVGVSAVWIHQNSSPIACFSLEAIKSIILVDPILDTH